ncbi:dehydrogenase [Phenylobacterium sp. Root77]|uniref:SDR family NAD(P)-dependent oxidoreductase n=1 Tax=unclassified Phenylobacterium TaxID=2640670 RepID=UPI0006FD44DB|nr:MULTISPECIES: glucose 1-dehydrogenase [unclassified Phenylobacterium]KQW68196.1 dehydrogenase [Phenylobacterium sp. Root1277]KQW91937.1 dehydrogenase [Phenylobacterium sp. Root1290]KRC40169.1 dehydrogenase [Phenylobacterium sp. Root77]
MAGRVEGKIALVTGGASGIGRGCAERLAQEGATIVVTDLQDDKGAQTVAAIEAMGGKASYLHHDVTSEQAWIDAIAAVKAQHGRLDILVNNAGIGIGGSVLTMTLADFQKQTAVNLDGVFLGVKHSIPLMRENGGGSIINMSSVAGLKGSAILAGYCATKGGVRLFTKAVAMECAAAKDGVRVNSVHPGIIETPIWDTIVGTGEIGDNARPPRGAALDAMSAEGVPLGVKGYPEDIANGVLWLASDESRYVTGAELVIDGGLSVK